MSRGIKIVTTGQAGEAGQRPKGMEFDKYPFESYQAATPQPIYKKSYVKMFILVFRLNPNLALGPPQQTLNPSFDKLTINNLHVSQLFDFEASPIWISKCTTIH